MNPVYWSNLAHKELQQALSHQPVVRRAKNVILFVGDGMGVSTVTAARIYKGQLRNRTGEEGLLFFETFPNIGMAKTYNVDKQTPDSAGTATAFLCGVKSNYGVIGLDASVQRGNCTAQKGHELTSVMDWSLKAGKAVGIVTTTRITHATPAAAYAHVADRAWEGDRDMPATAASQGCKDVALQLIEDNPDIKVILGGGRQYFMPAGTPDPETGTPEASSRPDGRDLIQEWLKDKAERRLKGQYVWNASSFYDVDVDNTDYLLGLFEASHMNYEYFRVAAHDPAQDEAGEPSLAEMTVKALRILQKEPRGYFLFVEGGRIDHAHHGNRAKLSLADAVAFDHAVQAAAEMTQADDTLIVVTADHSHAFIIAGYPSRGNSITGEEDVSLGSDRLPYTTLLYGNGPGYAVYQNGSREDVSQPHVDVEDVYYRQQAAVPLSSETHAGEDVPIYASGPMGHLFHATHEQHYIAHVIAYASCVGIYANEAECRDISSSAGQWTGTTLRKRVILFCVVAVWYLVHRST
ncbi:alkaline phosphatase-like [Pomacea canaliculata]|uniref:alkaline phosphatase-like n=1 Tax=Pomacea canaliculata TaxID=400727 RepID=UPI000D73EE41|nr:alkaline phosphatase-like [Pomacea canaliculata]